MNLAPESSCLVGLPVAALDTPCLVIDLDLVEQNLHSMRSALSGTTVRARPHSKTHKSPALAMMQLRHGAIGICCAKLSEAEVMAAAGVSGILITTEVVGWAKVQRLVGLARQTEVITVIDDPRAAQEISAAAVSAGVRISCLLDIDVGTNRTGVASGDAAIALGLKVAALPGLKLVGVQGYEGHLQHVVDVEERRALNGAAMQALSDTVALLRGRELQIDIVSTAGTGTFASAAGWDCVTEVQPGSYVFMDTDYGRVAGLQFRQSLTLIATVISIRNNGVIIDAGLKSLSTDSGMARPASIAGTYQHRGDEHGLIIPEDGARIALGDKVSLIPSHCDTTVNLHDAYFVVRSGVVVAVWPIASRGCVR